MHKEKIGVVAGKHVYLYEDAGVIGLCGGGHPAWLQVPIRTDAAPEKLRDDLRILVSAIVLGAGTYRELELYLARSASCGQAYVLDYGSARKMAFLCADSVRDAIGCLPEKVLLEISPGRLDGGAPLKPVKGSCHVFATPEVREMFPTTTRNDADRVSLFPVFWLMLLAAGEGVHVRISDAAVTVRPETDIFPNIALNMVRTGDADEVAATSVSGASNKTFMQGIRQDTLAKLGFLRDAVKRGEDGLPAEILLERVEGLGEYYRLPVREGARCPSPDNGWRDILCPASVLDILGKMPETVVLQLSADPLCALVDGFMAVELFGDGGRVRLSEADAAKMGNTTGTYGMREKSLATTFSLWCMLASFGTSVVYLRVGAPGDGLRVVTPLARASVSGGPGGGRTVSLDMPGGYAGGLFLEGDVLEATLRTARMLDSLGKPGKPASIKLDRDELTYNPGGCPEKDIPLRRVLCAESVEDICGWSPGSVWLDISASPRPAAYRVCPEECWTLRVEQALWDVLEKTRDQYGETDDLHRVLSVEAYLWLLVYSVGRGGYVYLSVHPADETPVHADIRDLKPCPQCGRSHVLGATRVEGGRPAGVCPFTGQRVTLDGGQGSSTASGTVSAVSAETVAA